MNPMLPEDPIEESTRPTAFQLIGGEPVLRSLVDRFYDLMSLEPRYLDLRHVHPEDLQNARDRLFWFLSGWMGGPNLYVERFGHPMLRARHLPFPIGIKERDQWLECMGQAMQEEAIAPLLAERLMESFSHTADWMRNR